MSTDFRTMAATLELPCSRRDFDDLMKIAKQTLQDWNCKWRDGAALIAGGDEWSLDYGAWDKATELQAQRDRELAQFNAQKRFWETLGVLIGKAELPFLTFGVATWCSRAYAQHCSGWWFRCMPNSDVVFPLMQWPAEASVDQIDAGDVPEHERTVTIS
jgi:hypothetical protein